VIKQKQIKLTYLQTNSMLADALTKSLGATQLQKLSREMTVTGKIGQMLLIFPVKLVCKTKIKIFCGDILGECCSHDLEAFCKIWEINNLKIRQF
jgi:hypothetical protein